MTKQTYSIKEACIALGMSRATIYRLAAAGEIKIKKILRKSFIEPSELHRLIANAPDAVEAGHIRPTKQCVALGPMPNSSESCATSHQ